MTVPTDYGRFVFLCGHPGCRAEARHHEYGMDRCDAHKKDLDPVTWPANVDEKATHNKRSKP